MLGAQTPLKAPTGFRCGVGCTVPACVTQQSAEECDRAEPAPSSTESPRRAHPVPTQPSCHPPTCSGGASSLRVAEPASRAAAHRTFQLTSSSSENSSSLRLAWKGGKRTSGTLARPVQETWRGTGRRAVTICLMRVRTHSTTHPSSSSSSEGAEGPSPSSPPLSSSS